MKTFKMVLDVGKGMVRVNVKVLPGCFKYVGGVEVLLYPVVRRVELGSASVTKVPVTVRRDPKGIVGFSSAVMGQVKRDMFGLSIMSRIKCMCMKGLLWE